MSGASRGRQRSNDKAATLPRLRACRWRRQAHPSRQSLPENSIAPGAAANLHRVHSNGDFASASRRKNSLFDLATRAKFDKLIAEIDEAGATIIGLPAPILAE